MQEDPACHLLRLPPELLHGIYGYLDATSMAHCRLVCSKLAIICAENLSGKLHLPYQLQRFRGLADFCENPIITKRMRTLIYHANRLKHCEDSEDSLLYTELVANRFVQNRMLYEGEQDYRMVNRVQDNLGNTNHQLLAAHEAYMIHIESQRKISKDAADLESLIMLFQKCTHLRSVKLTIHCTATDDRELVDGRSQML